MVRFLYVIGLCALLAAGVVLMHVSAQWRRDDPVLDELCDRPGVVAVLQQREDQGRNKGIRSLFWALVDGSIANRIARRLCARST